MKKLVYLFLILLFAACTKEETTEDSESGSIEENKEYRISKISIKTDDESAEIEYKYDDSDRWIESDVIYSGIEIKFESLEYNGDSVVYSIYNGSKKYTYTYEDSAVVKMDFYYESESEEFYSYSYEEGHLENVTCTNKELFWDASAYYQKLLSYEYVYDQDSLVCINTYHDPYGVIARDSLYRSSDSIVEKYYSKSGKYDSVNDTWQYSDDFTNSSSDNVSCYYNENGQVEEYDDDSNYYVMFTYIDGLLSSFSKYNKSSVLKYEVTIEWEEGSGNMEEVCNSPQIKVLYFNQMKVPYVYFMVENMIDLYKNVF